MGSWRGVQHLSSTSFNFQHFLACLCLSLPLIAKPSTHSSMSLWEIDCSLNQSQFFTKKKKKERVPTEKDQQLVRILLPNRMTQLCSGVPLHVKSNNCILNPHCWPYKWPYLEVLRLSASSLGKVQHNNNITINCKKLVAEDTSNLKVNKKSS